MASTTTEAPAVLPAPEPDAQPQPEAVAPWRNTRITRRAAFLGGLLLVVFAALFLRLWALQVLTGIDGTRRAETLSVEEFVRLANVV